MEIWRIILPMTISENKIKLDKTQEQKKIGIIIKLSSCSLFYLSSSIFYSYYHSISTRVTLSTCFIFCLSSSIFTSLSNVHLTRNMDKEFKYNNSFGQLYHSQKNDMTKKDSDQCQWLQTLPLWWNQISYHIKER